MRQVRMLLWLCQGDQQPLSPAQISLRAPSKPAMPWACRGKVLIHPKLVNVCRRKPAATSSHSTHLNPQYWTS